MKRDSVAEKGKERTAGERLGGLVCGVGVSVSVPSSPLLPLPTVLSSVSAHPRRVHPPNAIGSLPLPSLCMRRGGTVVECGARDGRGSILRRVEGVLGRAWHAHTPGRGGFKERDTLRQFIPVSVSVGIPPLR